MATSLLSSSEKEALELVMDDIHETFAREVTVFKEASHVVVITDPSFNPLYRTAGQTTSIINTPISRTFKARIKYEDDIGKRYWNEGALNSQVALEATIGTVRLKISAQDYDFIQDAKRFDVDGKRYLLISTFKPHGLFNTKYYTLYLKPDP